MGRRPLCAFCRSDRVARIVYGAPEMTKKLRRDLADESVVLGGPDGSNDPRWLCVRCRHDFGRATKPDPADVFRSLLDENAELIAAGSRLLTAGFDEEARAIARARGLLADRIRELGRKLKVEISDEALGPRTSKRDDRWSEAEATLAYELLSSNGSFPPQDDIVDLAEYLGRPVGSVSRELAKLNAARTGRLNGLTRRWRTEIEIVRRYGADLRQLRREARRIRREWNEPLPEERELSDLRKLEYEFWTALAKLLDQEGTTVRVTRPRHGPWYTMPIGRGGFYLALTVDTREKELTCSLVCQGAHGKSAFQQLAAERDTIESKLGPLMWDELPERQRTRISRSREFDLHDAGDWPDALRWCKTSAEEFHRAFGARVRSLLL